MLLVRPFPVVNESGRGYVLRVSGQNGLESPRWLLNLLTEKGIRLTGYPALERILNKPEHGLEGLRGPIANLAQLNASDISDLPIRYWNTRQPRFCPCCLKESSHWRASWDLVFSTACVKHGINLHDQCPKCLKHLSWDRSRITHCGCGHDLRHVETEKAPEVAVQLAREIEFRLQHERGSLENAIEITRTLDLHALLKLVWFLGAYSRNAHRKPQKIVGLETILVANSMVEQAMSILNDWPARFHRLLGEVVDRQSPASSSNKLGARFGWFYPALFKSFPGLEFEFLRLGFEDYLRAHWTGQLARRNRRLSPGMRSEHERVSIAEAVKMLKMRVGTVGRYLEKGVLVGELHVTKSGRKMSAIRLDSVKALMLRKQDWVSLKGARALLGVSRKRAYALLKQGVLKPISGPSVDGQILWCFQREDVLAITGLITSKKTADSSP